MSISSKIRPTPRKPSRMATDHSFKMKNFYADPFAISSISLAIVSWVIAIGAPSHLHPPMNPSHVLLGGV